MAPRIPDTATIRTYLPSLAPAPSIAPETFDSGSGSSTLTGNGGSDTYVIQPNAAQVTIVNGGDTGFAPNGEVQFQNGATANDLWFARSGGDLVVDVLGTSEQVTVQDWFNAPQAPVKDFVSADGLVLDSALNNLIQAMATFSANNPAFNPQTASAAPADAALQSAIAAAWHQPAAS